jgi:hypothetical protein
VASYRAHLSVVVRSDLSRSALLSLSGGTATRSLYGTNVVQPRLGDERRPGGVGGATRRLSCVAMNPSKRRGSAASVGEVVVCHRAGLVLAECDHAGAVD